MDPCHETALLELGPCEALPGLCKDEGAEDALLLHGELASFKTDVVLLLWVQGAALLKPLPQDRP